MGLFSRAIRPTDPNANDPALNPPPTVGPPGATPGDPDGVILTGDDGPGWTPPRVNPVAWSGLPEDWFIPWGGGSIQTPLTDVAWMCIDRNSWVLATCTPFLKGAAPSTPTGWLGNPDPNFYTSWEEFAKEMFWDFWAVGEAFVWATSYYATGYPSAFHVVPPWMVQITIENGLRHYEIGGMDVDEDLLHLRYRSQVGIAHGMGPLEAGSSRIVAAQVLMQYATTLAAGGGIPIGVLEHPAEQSPAQAAQLKADWVTARASSIGEPAVLSGGLKFTPTQVNPNDMALTGLLDRQESRIAYLLGVPAELVGIPTQTDPMTYKNVSMWTDLHWQTGLRPVAKRVMSALSGWLLPGGTEIDLKRGDYVAPEPLERAQAAQILAGIVDPVTGQQALTVAEIREAEGLDELQTSIPTSGVFK